MNPTSRELLGIGCASMQLPRHRISSLDLGTNRTYTANELNQYSLITNLTSDAGLQTSEFEPQYDDDGNQTLIQTSTGIWSVTYNGENRPVQWSSGVTNITMKFDRMGVAFLILKSSDP